MREDRSLTIEISPDADEWRHFLYLLQAGFSLRTRVPLSVRAFMRETLGFDESYIENTVSTVFLDGMPVDDIDMATVRDGSRIALSGALPGLVGAVMRRKSAYAAFREGISYRGAVTAPQPAEEATRQGIVSLKLFNAIMKDRGRQILSSGILVFPQTLDGFISLHGVGLEKCATAVEMDGMALAPGALHGIRFAKDEKGRIRLRVSPGNP